METKDLKNKYKKVKDSLFREGKSEILESLNTLYDAKIVLINSCKDCDSRNLNVCVKYNKNLEDVDKIPDYCQLTDFEEFIQLLDTIKDENYIKANFKR